LASNLLILFWVLSDYWMINWCWLA
jgi:hypothetical protein